MTSVTLAQSHLVKATKRLRILQVLLDEHDYSDVVREAQEIVELALKGILRQIGVEPPKQHDVGSLLEEYANRLPAEVRPKVAELARASKWLRKEREFAFYGDTDFVPVLEYSADDALQALDWAQLAVSVAGRVIPWPANLT